MAQGRKPKGSSDGGQFTRNASGKTPPAAAGVVPRSRSGARQGTTQPRADLVYAGSAPGVPARKTPRRMGRGRSLAVRCSLLAGFVVGTFAIAAVAAVLIGRRVLSSGRGRAASSEPFADPGVPQVDEDSGQDWAEADAVQPEWDWAEADAIQPEWDWAEADAIQPEWDWAEADAIQPEWEAPELESPAEQASPAMPAQTQPLPVVRPLDAGGESGHTREPHLADERGLAPSRQPGHRVPGRRSAAVPARPVVSGRRPGHHVPGRRHGVVSGQ